MIDQEHYDTAAARLRLGNVAIVVGLLRAEAAELRAIGRRAGALELERVARRLMRSTGAVDAPTLVGDAPAFVVSLTQDGRGISWR